MKKEVGIGFNPNMFNNLTTTFDEYLMSTEEGFDNFFTMNSDQYKAYRNYKFSEFIKCPRCPGCTTN